jgi:hypothetical protein
MHAERVKVIPAEWTTTIYVAFVYSVSETPCRYGQMPYMLSHTVIDFTLRFRLEVSVLIAVAPFKKVAKYCVTRAHDEWKHLTNAF